MSLNSLTSNILEIYPTAIRARYEELKNLSQEQSLWGYKFLSFKNLINLLYQETEGSNKFKVIDDITEMLLLEETVEEIASVEKDNLFLSRLKGFWGFYANLLDFIKELKQGDITPLQLQEVGKLMQNKKIVSLGKIYQKLSIKMEDAHLIDEFDKEKIVLESLREKKKFNLLQGIEQINFNDISRIYFLRFQLIKEIAAYVGKARATLPYYPQREDIDYLLNTIIQFESLGEETDAFDPYDIFKEIKSEGETLLSHIKNNVLGLPEKVHRAGRKRVDGSLFIIRARNPKLEITAIAREIRKLMKEEDIDLKKIGIICRNLSEYGGWIEEVFSEFKIPYFFRRGNPLRSNMLIRNLLYILEVIKCDFEAEKVAEIVYSPYFDFDIAKSKEDFLKIVYSRGMIKGNYEVWQKKIGEENLLPVLEFIQILQELKDTKESIPSFADKLLKIIKKYKVKDKILQIKDFSLMHRDIEGYKIFIEHLLKLKELPLNSYPKCDFDKFYALFLNSLSNINLPLEREIGGVFVLNCYDAIGFEFDYSFIVGLTEDKFPLKKYESFLLCDEERKEISKILGRNKFPHPHQKLFEDPYLFFLAVQSAKKRVYLTYPLIDEKGKASIPSTFVKSCLDLIEFEEEEEGKLFINYDLTFIPEIKEAFTKKEIINTLNLYYHSDEKLKELKDIYNIIQDCQSRQKIEEEREQFLLGERESDKYTGLIEDEKIKEEIIQDIKSKSLSITKLEDYGKCPYMFFLKNVLSVEDVEKPDFDLSKRELGIILHSALRDIYKDYPNITGEDFEVKKIVEDYLNRTIERMLKEKNFLAEEEFLKLRKEIAIQYIIALIEYERQSNSNWQPKYQECELDGFKIPGIDLTLSGRIDRLDVSKSPKDKRIRVIDYKLSGSGISEQLDDMKKDEPKYLGITNLQFPLYFIWGKEIMKEKTGAEIKEGEVGSYFLKDMGAKKESEKLKFIDWDENIENNFIKNLKVITSKLLDANFELRPYPNCFPFCPYNKVCRYEYIRGDKF